MHTVWKYPLDIIDGPQKLRLPAHAIVRMVGAQSDAQLALWIEVDTHVTAGRLKDRSFVVHGTGHEVAQDASYIGSVQMPPHVWHVFEV